MLLDHLVGLVNPSNMRICGLIMKVVRTRFKIIELLPRLLCLTNVVHKLDVCKKALVN